MVQWTFPQGDRDYLNLGRIQRLPLDVGSVPRKQHVVSRAILKGFAAPGTSGSGWSLRAFNVARNEVLKDRGVAGCAYVRDFIVYAAQSAELAWKAVEDRLPPAIAAARDGVLHASPSSDLRDTITDAVALHFVRNPRLLREESRLTAEATSDVRTRTLLERDAMLRDEFVRRYNLLPAGPQALEAVLDDAMTPWREHIRSGALARVTLESLFERIRDGLRGMPIEVWHVPSGTELLISDNAAFTFAYSDGDSKITMNMPFGDSHGAALPLARDCLVAIGPAAKDDVLLVDKVDLFNELQVRNADAHVYFRPGSGLETFVRRLASVIDPT
jgi:hypothetical protein